MVLPCHAHPDNPYLSDPCGLVVARLIGGVGHSVNEDRIETKSLIIDPNVRRQFTVICLKYRGGDHRSSSSLSSWKAFSSAQSSASFGFPQAARALGGFSSSGASIKSLYGSITFFNLV